MPLKDLLVTEQKVTEDLLEGLMSGLVLLAPDTKRAIFTGDGVALPSKAKVIISLAARHAWRFLEPGAEQDISMSLAELSEETGLAGNTLRPTVKQLKDRRMIDSPAPGRYRLPPHALAQAAAEVGQLRGAAGQGRAKG